MTALPIPGFYPVLLGDNMSCSRIKYGAASKDQIQNLLVQSAMLYHYATVHPIRNSEHCQINQEGSDDLIINYQLLYIYIRFEVIMKTYQ